MTQEVIDGIIGALADEFPDVPVYTDPVKQGLKYPCFLVQNLSAGFTPLLGRRFMWSGLFSVQYRPQSKTDGYEESYGAGERAAIALEYITCDGRLVRGVDRSVEPRDGVAVVVVTYRMFLRYAVEKPIMEELTIDNSVAD
jgi:hypothetical protein